ncbi:MAG: hypothetical protein J7L51_00590 [Desulfurococcales archaeon]|nr:hypothetical protein [Desulfurococcales archaeon]
MKCSACGKEFTMGATIIRTKVLCPECSEIYESIIEDCEAKVAEKLLRGETNINMDELLKEHEDAINRLGIRKSHFKAVILRRVVSARTRL